MGIINLNISMGSKNISNFKAKLELLYNDELGYLIDYRINFIEGRIDTLTTPSWPDEHKKSYKMREEIFKLIDLNQKLRKKRNDHDLVNLSDSQLLKLSKYFNSGSYDSTVYNIVAMFKGSNPSGAYKNPSAAQIWETDTKKDYKIHIFCGCFMNKEDKNSRNYKQSNEEYWLFEKNRNNIDNLEFYLNLYPDIKKIFLELQQNNNDRTAMNRTKKIAKKLMSNIYVVSSDSNKEFIKYRKGILHHYENLENAYFLIFDKKSIDSIQLQCCHILPRWFIRRKMLENFGKGETYDNWLYKISDKYNFLPLDANVHNNGFDFKPAKLFWDTDGELQIKDISWYQQYKNTIDNYKSINKKELDLRKKYLEEYTKYNIWQKQN